ncbi:MAG: protein-disulfide reductase DsbD domain-containing protein [Planctomycetota bacterium]
MLPSPSLRLPRWLPLGLCALLTGCAPAAAPNGAESQRLLQEGQAEAIAGKLPAAADPLVSLRLVAEHGSLAPGTETRLGLAITVAPGWHTYGRSPSDSGVPLTVSWRLAEGLEVSGELRWPAPQRYVAPGALLDHVYEGTTTLVLPIRLAPTALPGTTLDVQAEVEWLVCKEACLLGSGSASLRIPITATGARPAVVPAETLQLFRDTEARLPRAAQAGALPTIAQTDREVVVTLRGAKLLRFLPEPDCVTLPRLVTEGEALGDTLRLSLPTRPESNASGGRLSGLLEASFPGAGPQFYAIEHRLDP